MKKIKTVFIIWIAIYPAITFMQLLFGDQLSELPILARTFALTVILVPLMVYILIPFWTWVFDKTEVRIAAFKSKKSGANK